MLFHYELDFRSLISFFVVVHTFKNILEEHIDVL